MARELIEEIELEPKDVQLLDTSFFEDGNVVTKFWIQLTFEEMIQLKLGEGQRMDFFTLDELLRLNIIPNLRNYITLNKTHLIERLRL